MWKVISSRTDSSDHCVPNNVMNSGFKLPAMASGRDLSPASRLAANSSNRFTAAQPQHQFSSQSQIPSSSALIGGSVSRTSPPSGLDRMHASARAAIEASTAIHTQVVELHLIISLKGNASAHHDGPESCLPLSCVFSCAGGWATKAASHVSRGRAIRQHVPKQTIPLGGKTTRYT